MAEITTWSVEPPQKGERLDVMLAQRFPDRSRASLQSLVKQALVTVNGLAAKPGYRLKVDDAIRVEIPNDPPPPSALAPTPMNMTILFEDDDLIAVNKPVGLVVHPGAGREVETVVSSVLSHTALSPVGEPFRPGVVHRLDKGTSGVLILAKNEFAHQRLVKAFAGRKMEKEYLAIVQGHPESETGRIEVAMERDRAQRQRMMATVAERGKPAVSLYEVLEQLPGAALVRIRILTGRTHQIRVHMAYIGHPLVGDTTYGGRTRSIGTGHFLHSRSLRFQHPRARTILQLEAPLPEAFEQALAELRRQQTEEKKPGHLGKSRR